MISKASVFGRFQGAVLFGTSQSEKIMLQVCSDFDFTKKEIDCLLGTKSTSYFPGLLKDDSADPQLFEARVWRLSGEKAYDKVFARFFRQYTEASQVRHKPALDSLVLVPIDMDTPLVPNDFLENKRG